MTFLKNLMSFQEPGGSTIGSPQGGTKAAGSETRTEKVQAIFAKLFATPTTIAAAAAARAAESAKDGEEPQEFSAVGMAQQVYRYEKKELMARRGTADTAGRAVLWLWVGK